MNLDACTRIRKLYLFLPSSPSFPTLLFFLSSLSSSLHILPVFSSTYAISFILRIYLQDNKITTLAGSISKFKFLEVLLIHNNLLRDLQSILDQLVHHRHLKQLSMFFYLNIIFGFNLVSVSFLFFFVFDHNYFALFFNITCIDLLGNPCAEEESYREIVISRLPLLEIFDRHGTHKNTYEIKKETRK